MVVINRFTFDTKAGLEVILNRCDALGINAAVADVFALGGRGGLEMAERLMKVMANQPSEYRPLYGWRESVRRKIFLIASEIYGAKKVEYTDKATIHLKWIEKLGLNELPICMTKTQKSFFDDPTLLGRPEGFTITVREIRIAAGAGFLVPLTGEMLTMPGLPRHPAADSIDIDARGKIKRLF